jgi:hypothetical protein
VRQYWSSIAGSVLCKACYSMFQRCGTLERQQRPLTQRKAARVDPMTLRQVAAEGGGRAGKRKTA